MYGLLDDDIAVPKLPNGNIRKMSLSVYNLTTFNRYKRKEVAKLIERLANWPEVIHPYLLVPIA